jgi:hypothetical protein
MDKKILDFIEEIQRGKSGIYPYRVAQEVAIKFQISMERAQEYVSQHIKDALKEVTK